MTDETNWLGFGTAGLIGSGKSFFLNTVEEFLNGETSVEELEKYPILAMYAGKFKVLHEDPDSEVLDVFYKAINIVKDGKGITPKTQRICFVTQMHFVKIRLINDALKYNATRGGGLYGEDRIFEEDKLFPLLQVKKGYLSEAQFNVYMNLYEALLKNVKPRRPNFIIYLDVTPETAHKNLLKRGERNITKEYVKDLHNVYQSFKEEMTLEYGDSFVIVDNNTNISKDEILTILNKRLSRQH